MPEAWQRKRHIATEYPQTANVHVERGGRFWTFQTRQHSRQERGAGRTTAVEFSNVVGRCDRRAPRRPASAALRLTPSLRRASYAEADRTHRPSGWDELAVDGTLLSPAQRSSLSRFGRTSQRTIGAFTLNYDDLDAHASAELWDKVGEVIGDTARRVEQAGADYVMITAVTGHAVPDQVAAALGVPLLHIADPAAEALRAAGARRVGLLGTRFTMDGFLQGAPADQHGLDIVTPLEPAGLHGAAAADAGGTLSAAGARRAQAACRGGGSSGTLLVLKRQGGKTGS